MITMMMVETPLDEIIDMVAVWNGGVSTTWPVNVAILLATSHLGLTAVGVLRIDLKPMLVIMRYAIDAVRMVQMSVVEIVDMIAMADREVATVWPMNVIVIWVGVARRGHRNLPHGRGQTAPDRCANALTDRPSPSSAQAHLTLRP